MIVTGEALAVVVVQLNRRVLTEPFLNLSGTSPSVAVPVDHNLNHNAKASDSFSEPVFVLLSLYFVILDWLFLRARVCVLV